MNTPLMRRDQRILQTVLYKSKVSSAKTREGRIPRSRALRASGYRLRRYLSGAGTRAARAVIRAACRQLAGDQAVSQASCHTPHARPADGFPPLRAAAAWNPDAQYRPQPTSNYGNPPTPDAGPRPDHAAQKPHDR
jgi:hypothetical protein